MQFNIFDQLQTELDEFYKGKVHIAGTQGQGDAKYLKKEDGGYTFSQWETINLIELYYNSKFESGPTDSEGQCKVFLNISRFRADVAAKQTDIDVKDFVFVPDDNASTFGAFFLTKQFKGWARKRQFGSVINELNQDFSKFGSCVAKRVGSNIERIPLNSLIVQQDAKSLKTARYVIQKHEDMTYDEMEAMKNWDVTDLDIKFGEKHCVYERHGIVQLSWYKQQKGLAVEEGDDMRSIDVMAILLPYMKDKKESKGAILFMEKETKRPYEEAHWAKVDGRWLGFGEVENQFENQVSRNMTANLRKRAMYWSSKHVFQSSDTEIAKNLVRNVKDGDVLKIMPNGNITPVAIETRNLAEFDTNDAMWEKNSDQKSFTYEVATGEALPSGTPFRLGVVMSNAVNSHFALKRENFGMFLSNIVSEQLLDVFKKENSKEHTVLIANDEKGIESLKREMVAFSKWQNFKDQLLNGILPDLQAIEQKVQEEIDNRQNHDFTVPEGFYDYIKATVDIVTTGENVNIEKKIETLTNFYNTLVQSGDMETAKVVMKRILALTGEDVQNYQSNAQQQPQMQQMIQQAGQGQLPTQAQQPVNTAV
jgi:hypothetical protein